MDRSPFFVCGVLRQRLGLFTGICALFFWPGVNSVEAAARSVQVVFHNHSDKTLTLERAELAHGIWTKQPPRTIGPHKQADWASESDGFATGTEGRAVYHLQGNSHAKVQLHWDNPFAGSNSYDEHAPPGFHLANQGGAGNNAHIVWTLKKIGLPPLPRLPIQHLAVRVVTSTVHLAGTDNDVYFDIGGLGWKLSRSNLTSGGKLRQRGSDNTHELDLHGLKDLTTDDIHWLRLQKKGVGGFTGTPDGIDGAWKPARIHLLVNHKEYVQFEINQWLDIEHPSWGLVLRPQFRPAELFARSLRLRINDKLGSTDEGIAALTTPFKEMHISGWIQSKLPVTTAIGKIRQIGHSTDTFVTIDLELESVQVGRKTFSLDGKHRIPHQRFLRIEYRAPAEAVLGGLGEGALRIDQRVQIAGAVKWDTDREGHWEIHPHGPKDVKILK
jgi:hypothetical protein